MSAARLDIRWEDDPWGPVDIPLTLVRPVTRHQSQLRCPACDSILYSRRHRLCGVCGAGLPEELLFSVAEAFRVQALVRTEQEKHRAWMSRRLELEVN